MTLDTLYYTIISIAKHSLGLLDVLKSLQCSIDDSLVLMRFSEYWLVIFILNYWGVIVVLWRKFPTEIMQIHDVSKHKLYCAPKYAVALSCLFTSLHGYEGPRLLRCNFVSYINYVYANLTIYLCYLYLWYSNAIYANSIWLYILINICQSPTNPFVNKRDFMN